MIRTVARLKGAKLPWNNHFLSASTTLILKSSFNMGHQSKSVALFAVAQNSCRPHQELPDLHAPATESAVTRPEHLRTKTPVETRSLMPTSLELASSVIQGNTPAIGSGTKTPRTCCHGMCFGRSSGRGISRRWRAKFWGYRNPKSLISTCGVSVFPTTHSPFGIC